MFEVRLRLRVWQTLGLGHLNAPRRCQLLHRRWRERETTPGRSIRLSDHADHAMTGLEQSLKALCRKFRSASEQDIHGSGTRSGFARKAALRRSSNNEESNPVSGRLAELFLKFRLDALLLEARKIIDENLALEVIHLVLDADCEEFLCDEGERSAVQAKRTHRHALGTLDRLVYSPHRQAALLTILDAFAV